VFPTGTVHHPDIEHHVSALTFPLVFGRPVVVTARFVHIFVPRRTRDWTEHWAGNRGRRIPRLRRITVDTFRQRIVLGDGVFARRGRVVYTAGPRVNYRAIVAEHLAALIAGTINDWGSPITTVSNPVVQDPTPITAETISQ
jgi:hypothetical protein